MKEASASGLYVHAASLTVLGSRAPQISPEEKNLKPKYSRKNLNLLNLDVQENDGFEKVSNIKEVKNKKPKKKLVPVKISTRLLYDEEVINKELRQIYQTKKVEDFKRIFDQLYRSERFRRCQIYSEDSLLGRLDPDAIYSRFYSRHYDNLAERLS